MTSPGRRDPDRPVSVFLVERYLPPSALESLAASVARAARLCAASAEAGAGVHYLQSAYLPTEDTCFCLFRAVTADAVRALNNEAEFALDRITDAVLLLSLPTTPGRPEPGRTRSR
jgi:hypothetical protein